MPAENSEIFVGLTPPNSSGNERYIDSKTGEKVILTLPASVYLRTNTHQTSISSYALDLIQIAEDPQTTITPREEIERELLTTNFELTTPNHTPRRSLRWLVPLAAALALSYAVTGVTNNISADEPTKTPTKPPLRQEKTKPETTKSISLRQQVDQINTELRQTATVQNLDPQKRINLHQKAQERQKALLELLKSGHKINHHLLQNTDQLAQIDPELSRYLEKKVKETSGQVVIIHEHTSPTQSQDTAKLMTPDKNWEFHNETSQRFKAGDKIQVTQAMALGDHLIISDASGSQASIASRSNPGTPPHTSTKLNVLNYASSGQIFTQADRDKNSVSILDPSNSAESHMKLNTNNQFAITSMQQFPATNAYTLTLELCDPISLFNDAQSKLLALGIDPNVGSMAIFLKDSSICTAGAYTLWQEGNQPPMTVYKSPTYWDYSAILHEFLHAYLLLHHASFEGSEYALYDGAVGNNWFNIAKINKAMRLNSGVFNLDQVINITSAGRITLACNYNDTSAPQMAKIALALPDPYFGYTDLIFECYGTSEIGPSTNKRPEGYRGVSSRTTELGEYFQHTSLRDLSPENGEHDVRAVPGQDYQIPDGEIIRYFRVENEPTDENGNKVFVRFANILGELEATATATATGTSTNTSTPTFTSTPTQTQTGTATATNTPTGTPSPTSTWTLTPLPTSTSTKTATATGTSTPSPTMTFEPDSTRTPTSTSSPFPSPTRSATPSPTSTEVPTINTQTPTVTNTVIAPNTPTPKSENPTPKTYQIHAPIISVNANQ